jgi:hypothetical protein
MTTNPKNLTTPSSQKPTCERQRELYLFSF